MGRTPGQPNAPAGGGDSGPSPALLTLRIAPLSHRGGILMIRGCRLSPLFEAPMTESTKRGHCPYCGGDDSCDHLLAFWDCTFATSSEVYGLNGGSIYGVEAELSSLLSVVGRFAIADHCAKQIQHPSDLDDAWISSSSALSWFLQDLESAVPACLQHGSAADAPWQLSCFVDSFGRAVRECVDDLLSEAGVHFSTEESFDDVPRFSSDYVAWYTPDAQEATKRLARHIRSIRKPKENAYQDIYATCDRQQTESVEDGPAV